MSTYENLLHPAHGTIIGDLCLTRDIYYQSTHLFSHADNDNDNDKCFIKHKCIE